MLTEAAILIYFNVLSSLWMAKLNFQQLLSNDHSENVLKNVFVLFVCFRIFLMISNEQHLFEI